MKISLKKLYVIVNTNGWLSVESNFAFTSRKEAKDHIKTLSGTMADKAWVMHIQKLSHLR
jgi:hypothetical protein